MCRRDSINKVKQMDAVSIVNFSNQGLPLLTTDMTSGEILGYAMEALQMNFDSEQSCLLYTSRCV